MVRNKNSPVWWYSCIKSASTVRVHGSLEVSFGFKSGYGGLGGRCGSRCGSKWTGSFTPSAICQIANRTITILEISIALPFAIDMLIKTTRFVKHVTLWKQEEWCHIVVDDRSSSDIGQTEEWCETFGFMMTMSMIITQNAWTIQQPFKDGNNSSDHVPSSRRVNNEKIKIPTAPRHLQIWFRCQHPT